MIVWDDTTMYADRSGAGSDGEAGALAKGPWRVVKSCLNNNTLLGGLQKLLAQEDGRHYDPGSWTWANFKATFKWKTDEYLWLVDTRCAPRLEADLLTRASGTRCTTTMT